MKNEKWELKLVEEAEVGIQFDLSKIDVEKLFEIEKLLREIGIGFDTGAVVGGHGIRDWEWDWSLSGPVKVFFRRFVKDNPKNRYFREKERDKKCDPA